MQHCFLQVRNLDIETNKNKLLTEIQSTTRKIMQNDEISNEVILRKIDEVIRCWKGNWMCHTHKRIDLYTTPFKGKLERISVLGRKRIQIIRNKIKPFFLGIKEYSGHCRR